MGMGGITLALLALATAQFNLIPDMGHRLERRRPTGALAVPTWQPPKSAADRLHERQHRLYTNAAFAALPMGPGIQLAETGDEAPAPPREDEKPRSRWGVLGEAWAPELPRRVPKTLAPPRSWAQGGHVAGPQ